MLALSVRLLHVLAMAAVTGASVFLCLLFLKSGDTSPECRTHQVYAWAKSFEWLFWIAMGILAMTGVGNLGAFGRDLPELNTVWGQTFITKLSVLLLFLILSLFRTFLVAWSEIGQDLLSSVTGRRILIGSYVATACFLVTFLGIAMSLAHG